MSSTYNVTTAALVGNVVTLGLTTVGSLVAGWPIRVEGLGVDFDGNHTISTVNATTSTITYPKNHANIAQASVAGILHLRVTWADATDAITFLGIAPVETVDVDWLDFSVEAANTWCWDRREAAGYVDIPTVAANQRVKLGTVLKIGELYRSRGQLDGYASFQNLEGIAPIQSNAELLRMLGLNRPAIA